MILRIQVDSGLKACVDFLRALLLSRKADSLNLDKWQFARVPMDLSQYLHVLVCVCAGVGAGAVRAGGGHIYVHFSTPR